MRDIKDHLDTLNTKPERSAQRYCVKASLTTHVLGVDDANSNPYVLCHPLMMLRVLVSY